MRQVIQQMEERYPGIQERLCADDRLHPHIAVAVDGEVRPKDLRQKVSENSEIHFIPAISGGQP